MGDINAFADDRKPDGTIKLSENDPSIILLNIFSSGDNVSIPSRSLSETANSSATIKRIVTDSVQRGFPTSVAMHLADLLVKNQNEVVTGKVTLENVCTERYFDVHRSGEVVKK